MKTKTPKKSPAVACTKTAASALATLRAEYLRQLAALALELRPGFELGAFGADVEADLPRSARRPDRPTPADRLNAAIRERLADDDAVAVMVRSASPNRWQALDGDWNTDQIAIVETVAIDLCVIAEAQGWTRPKVRETWRTPGSPSPVQPVPVRLPGKAA